MDEGNKKEVSEKEPEGQKDEKRPVAEKVDNNLTISTKLSTEQLICKTPQDSPRGSLKCGTELQSTAHLVKAKNQKANCSIIYLANLQMLFGLLMIVAGSFVIYYNASLHQIGSGIWGGSFATITGIIGVIALARRMCPLTEESQKVTHTVYLVLSLICVAVSQLVLVLAATGLARDFSKADLIEISEEVLTTPSSKADEKPIPEDYYTLLSNVALILASALEFICSAVSSYKSARKLCSCFRKDNDNSKGNYSQNSHAIVSSWLGKHSPTAPLYVVAAAPTSVGSRSKISANYPTSIYAMPPAMLAAPPQVLRYPLIPAPLGPVPSPIIPPNRREKMHTPSRDYAVPIYHQGRSKKPRVQAKEKTLTTEDVAKTYTGLDRVIAEEFIEICDSRNNSLCSSESSCQSCSKSDECNCQSSISKSSMSDTTFKRYK